jgi:hypothetical protein
MVEAVTVGRSQSCSAKWLVINILVSKFLENNILRSPLWRMPRPVRLSACRTKKIICDPDRFSNIALFRQGPAEIHFSWRNPQALLVRMVLSAGPSTVTLVLSHRMLK